MKINVKEIYTVWLFQWHFSVALSSIQTVAEGGSAELKKNK